MEWEHSVLAEYIIAVVLATNAVLFGLYKGLGFIKDKTKSNVDNSAYDLIGKVLGFLQKIIEIVGPVTAVKSISNLEEASADSDKPQPS